MDAFSLLNFWRHAGVKDSVGIDGACLDAAINPSHPEFEMDDEGDDGEDSFFDLDFQVPNCNADKVEIHRFIDDDENRFKDSKRRISPPKQNPKPQSPISLLRSPPKFRVFMTGFKKSKLESTATNKHQPHKSTNQRQKNHFTVKYKVEEISIGSLFARDTNFRSKITKQDSEDSSSEESSKRFPKDVLHKYLNLIKPLYVRVSKRYVSKMKSPDNSSTTTTPLSTPVTAPTIPRRKPVYERQGHRPAALRVVCKHLGKSRSASSDGVGVVHSGTSRRDDSLLQQHDGIQSAIMHCKRSFNSPSESSILSRSVSEAWHDKSIIYLEQTRCSI